MKKTDYYYIVDTNLLISSVLRENSTPHKGLQKIESLNGVLVFSSVTFEELEKVMRRPKFDKYVSLERRENALSFIAQLGLFVIPQKKIHPLSRLGRQ
jgi:putative PIN family toxin of toxin-antitoxin system